jgi:multidrug efflux pump subunit AcrA (membrane-fusion protein)
VRAGERVFRIATPTRRWLQVRVPEHYAAQLHATSGAWFDHPATGTQILDSTTGARVVQVSASVEPKSRTASVTLEYPRETGPDLVGSRFAAHLFTRPAEPRLAVPRSALVDDGGRQVVFVHSGGETFARREVQTGIVDGDWIEIVSGLSAGERVVSQGAWSVRLAASGGDDIGHGHAH